MRPYALAAALLAAHAAAACAQVPPPPAGPEAAPPPALTPPFPLPRPPDAWANLQDRNGARLGYAAFTRAPRGVLIQLVGDTAAARLPGGFHGLHLHARGDCSAPTFQSAGPHAKHGTGATHGLLGADPEAGDLPNLWVSADGAFHAELFTTLVTLDQLLDADGSSLVIHAGVDDHLSQPIGGAGDRIACGVLRPN